MVYKDEFVTLCDGAISTEAGMVSGSKRFRRDELLLLFDLWTPMGIEQLFTEDMRRAIREGIQFKECRHVDHKGRKLLPTTEFYADNRAEDGLDSYCKECRSDIQFAYREARAKREKRKVKHRKGKHRVK